MKNPNYTAPTDDNGCDSQPADNQPNDRTDDSSDGIVEPSSDPHHGKEKLPTGGSQKLSPSDERAAFVVAFLDSREIDILFDGTLRFREKPTQQWGGIESVLLQFEPDELWVLEELVRSAERSGLPHRRAHLQTALRNVIRQARLKRRVVVGGPLFNLLGLGEEEVVEAKWSELEAIFDDVPKLCIAVLKHFIWQVKRKLRRLAVEQHLMPIITSSIQGSGKTTFVERFLAPLDDLAAKAVLLSDLADPRSGDVFSFAAGFVDDVGVLDRRSVETLKSVVTANSLTRRRMGTSRSTSIAQMTTLIGTANRSVDELIVDETGNRRFVMLPFKNGDDKKGGDPEVWPAIRSMDAALLWKSVDPLKPSPLEPFRQELHEWQEASRPKSDVEAWAVDLDVTSQPVKAITITDSVKARGLYQLFLRQTESNLSETKFGTVMKRLTETNPRVPFGKKVITREGTFYPLKPPK